MNEFFLQNKKRILTGLFFLIAILGVIALLYNADKDSLPEERMRSVRYQQVSKISSGQMRTFSGIAAADNETHLSFKVSGTIIKLIPVVGDRIHKGQVVAQLDSRDYVLRAQEGEANLDKAKAEARNAKVNYERVQALYENHNASLNELDSTRASFESGRAAVHLLEKQLEYLKLQENYATLLAPGDCMVADVKPKENENISVGQPVFTLTCGEKTKVKVTIPEAVIGFIKKADPVMVAFDAIQNLKFDAIVSEVGVASTEQGTTYPVTVQLNEVHADIRSGMAAQVTFTLQGGYHSKMVVPTGAVASDRQGHYVFVVQLTKNEQGVVYRRAVQVGDLTVEGIEISKGLTEQELVVTAGVNQLHDKQKVRLLKQSRI